MQVMLVRNATAGPLVLVDERGGDRQEYQWGPQGSALSDDLLEVPGDMAGNINFRRNVKNGNLVIERTLDENEALMGPSDADWVAQQQALSAGGGVPSQIMGETRTADGVTVVMDKQATAPISTISLDENGEIVNVQEAPPEQRQRGRETPSQPAEVPAVQQSTGVPETAGGHLDPNAP